MLPDRIARFIADPAAGSFDALAREAFAFQYERIPPFRLLCDRRGVRPGLIDDWRAVPAVPALAFKSLELHTEPPRETFRSSGTTAAERSIHHHPYPDLYRATIEHSFPGHCLPAGAPVPMLSLVPPRALAPDSSLSFMIDHVLARWATPDSVVALALRGVEVARARSWLGAQQRAHRPVLVLSTALALGELLDALDRQGLRFRLPAGSAVFETGGFKGRSRERRSRGLPVGAGDDQRPAMGEEEARQGLGHRQLLEAQALHFLDFDIGSRHGVADDDQLGPGLEVRRGEAHRGPDSCPGEERRHRGVEGAVGAADGVAFFLQQAGERRHARAADRDAVDIERTGQEVGGSAVKRARV